MRGPTTTRGAHRALAIGLAAVLAACSGTYEDSVRHDLPVAHRALARPDGTPAPPPDGTLASYVEYAMLASPELRASYERWRAATLRIAEARQLPNPMVMYGFYFGPDMHRLGVEQELPWPTALTGAADAQSGRARATERIFEAKALALRARVADAWWRLWVTRRTRAILREQLEVLDGLSATLRARLEVDQATLADLAQADLTRSRLDDAIAGLGEEERAAEAALRAVIGAPPDLPVPSENEPPPPRRPGETERALREAARVHPFIDSFELMAEAGDADARSLEGQRLPRFRVGVEWMFDHDRSPAMQSEMEGVIASLGVSVPLWQGAYGDAQRAAEADAAADRAEGERAVREAFAALSEALAAVRDAERRAHLYGETLLPQAESAYESVIGAYAVGRSNVAAALLAERDLLEVSLGLVQARADHGRAWARLESVVGRPVRPAPARTEQNEEVAR
jgi:outer membrane protein TolC